jgi:hypothetical protein
VRLNFFYTQLDSVAFEYTNDDSSSSTSSSDEDDKPDSKNDDEVCFSSKNIKIKSKIAQAE